MLIESHWQALHNLAEPAFKESKTSKYMADALRELGYEVIDGLTPAKTGVIAILDSGANGPVVGLRTDLDALIFTEDGKQIYVHACGHDGHMSMLLTAAEQIKNAGIKKGKVKLVLQPAEEIGLGAKALLETGLLDDIDYLFGMHLMPHNLLSSGQVAAKVNWMACTLMTVELTGLTAHGSMPHLGINALDAGCAIVNAVNAFHLNPLEGWSAKATRFNTGTGSINAICDHAEISFDLRTTLNSSMELLKEKFIKTVQATALAYGTQVKITEVGDCPGTESAPDVLAIIEKAIVKEMGPSALVHEVTTTVGEDFNFYRKLRPSIQTGFLGLGCDLEPCLHDRHMHFDHAQLPHGANIFTNIVLQILNA
ncbi:MAG: amidohydrolase [Phascolarctobacterium sp.]|nr:amidohydrolase [Phascolarctobacterium sp.]